LSGRVRERVLLGRTFRPATQRPPNANEGAPDPNGASVA
jgi:hypothetical protein